MIKLPNYGYVVPTKLYTNAIKYIFHMDTILNTTEQAR